jgi:hypothetical protein
MNSPLDAGSGFPTENGAVLSESAAAALKRFEERTQDIVEAEARKQDEIGARLKLPELLEQRRRQFKIPEAAFAQTALFDRILVAQCDKFGETYGEAGLIVKPAGVKDRQEEETPRGVIVSAGLHALDVMWGHGIEVGHIVNFAHLSPWRLYLDDHYKEALVVLRDGDLLASDDVRELERTGVLRVEMREVPDGRGVSKRQHVYFDTRTNSVRVPWAPMSDGEI